jgi:tyrosyl-tRNA synthetase
VLSEAEVKTNATTYLEQAFKILDRAKTEVRFNSEWFAKMSLGDLLNLSRKMTVAQMLERDDFSKRYAANAPISIVEFLYPLIQGHDSVMIKSDVELGGSDQLFNNLVGRVLQKEAGQPEQIVICTPLLVGLDGVKKMSKSSDNYIAFNDAPKEMFGKIMSISDTVMWDYYSLLLEASDETIAELKAGHPMAAKKNLALTLVSKFHGAETGKHELEQFEKVFARHEIPDDIKIIPYNTLSFKQGSAQTAFTVSQLLSSTGEFESNKEIHRLIKQGSVKLNDEKITDPFYSVPPPSPEEPHIIQSGKRKFFKFVHGDR